MRGKYLCSCYLTLEKLLGSEVIFYLLCKVLSKQTKTVTLFLKEQVCNHETLEITKGKRRTVLSKYFEIKNYRIQTCVFKFAKFCSAWVSVGCKGQTNLVKVMKILKFQLLIEMAKCTIYLYCKCCSSKLVFILLAKLNVVQLMWIQIF